MTRPSDSTDPAAAKSATGLWRSGGLLAGGLAGLVLGLLLEPLLAAPQDGDQGRILRQFPMTSAGGATADSNGRMIAVTGVDITGQSVLYVVDTEAMQLAAYQASGGASATQGLKLVGARRIDLDLQLEGFNDKTEHNGKPLRYGELLQQFGDAEDE